MRCMTRELKTAFLTHVTDGDAYASGPVSLGRALQQCLDAGRAAWPSIRLEPAYFMRWLAERSRGGELLAPDRAADLYLACACARGDDVAIAAFVAAFEPVVARAVARIDASDAFREDVLQALQERLFVGAVGEPGSIAQYAARASLRSWVTTVAKRVALNMRRRKDDQDHDEIASGVQALGATPEMEVLKARCKRELEAAVRAALAKLPAAQRSLLLLHLVHGVSLPKLAIMERVSRATVVRRLAAAREALQDGTKRELVGRLGLTASEYDSIAALVRSQVELELTSIERA
jgi:RNA polymerase sigma-70 factor (ECF subfamily)